jgi:spermidine/putrescine transport system permease protein
VNVTTTTTGQSTVKKAARSGQTLIALALLAPGTLLIFGLAIVPLALIARNSFANADGYGGVRGGFTLDQYAHLADPVYAKTLAYSLGVAAVNTIVCVAVGYLISYYVVSLPPGRQPLFLLALIIPFWTDFLVRTFAWMTLLGSGGPVVGVLHGLGLEGTDTLIPGQTAVVLALLYAFLPTAVFPIYASMRGIDPALREAAADLGCGWWRTHVKVIAPLSATGIAGAVLLTFVPTLGVFVIPVLLGGGKQLLVGNLIVTLYTEFRNQPMGAALSMIVLALMLISLGLAAAALRARSRSARWTA